MAEFGYRCRYCGETWYLVPTSTIHCEWCAGKDPFGGDTCHTRPTFDELAARRATPQPQAQGSVDELLSYEDSGLMYNDPPGSEPVRHLQPQAAATGDVWLRHDEDLRYVRRVLEAGRDMTEEDRGAAITIVHGLRTTARAKLQPQAGERLVKCVKCGNTETFLYARPDELVTKAKSGAGIQPQAGEREGWQPQSDQEWDAKDAARLDWLMHRLSGKDLRRIGIETASGGPLWTRVAIDAAMLADTPKAGELPPYEDTGLMYNAPPGSEPVRRAK